MNSCASCGIKLNKSVVTGVCVNCKKNEMITTTNIKKYFGLTADDLQDNDLFVLTLKGTYSGTKYIISQIIKLVEKIIDQTTDIKMKNKLLDKYNKYNRKKLITDFLLKSKFKFVTDEMQQLINNYIDINVTSIDVVSKQITEEYNKKIKYEQKREEIINNINKELMTTFTNKQILLEKCDINEDKYNYMLNKKKNTWLVDELKKNSTYINFITNMNIYLINEGELEKSGVIKTLYVKATKIINELYNKKFINDRKNELIKKLGEKSLMLRSDSHLCNHYINGGMDEINDIVKDKTIKSIDDIVNIMDEMNFYYSETDYGNEVKKLKNMYTDYYSDDYDDSYDHYYNRNKYLTKSINEINEEAKSNIIKNIKNININKLPLYVRELYDKINAETTEKSKKKNMVNKDSEKPDKIKKK